MGRVAMFLRLLAAIVGLVLAGMVTAAQAVTIFTDQSAWEAAVTGSTTTDDFNNTYIPTANSITLGSGIQSTFVGTGSLASNAVLNRNFVTFVGVGKQRETQWDFPTAVTAFAFDFLSIMNLTVSGDFDGSGNQTISVFDEAGTSGFFGILGQNAFTSILFGSNSLTVEDGINLDNAYFVAAIPIPAALPLFGTGIALMVFFGWRRKRKAASAT